MQSVWGEMDEWISMSDSLGGPDVHCRSISCLRMDVPTQQPQLRFAHEHGCLLESGCCRSTAIESVRLYDSVHSCEVLRLCVGSVVMMGASRMAFVCGSRNVTTSVPAGRESLCGECVHVLVWTRSLAIINATAMQVSTDCGCMVSDATHNRSCPVPGAEWNTNNAVRVVDG